MRSRALLGAAFLLPLASPPPAAADTTKARTSVYLEEEEPAATSGAVDGAKDNDATASGATASGEGESSEGEASEAEAEAKESPAEDSGRPSPLDIQLGLRMYSRSFRYTDTLDEQYPGSGYGQPTTYNVAAAPMYLGHANWYPAAHFTGGWPAHIGVTGGYELGFATTVAYSSNEGNFNLAQSHWMWWVGPKIRIPIDTHSLGIFATYGNHNYAILGDDKRVSGGESRAADPIFPDVRYEFIDVGLDAKLRFEQLRVGAHAQYRIVLNSGQIESSFWYPNTKTSGVTFGGEVGWKLSDMFDIMFGIDSLQYGLNFNPVTVGTATNKVAGGATDRYISAWAALQFYLPGKEPSGPAGAPTTPGGAPAQEKKPGGGETFDTFDEDF